MNSKYRKYVTYTAAVGVLTLSVFLGGCTKESSSEAGDATPSEVNVIQAVPETIAQLGLDGQVLPGLNDINLPDAEPAPEYLRIGVRHEIIKRLQQRLMAPKAIVREIERLVADGVVEIMLLGQNVNSYGKNLEHPMTFAQLLQEIEKIEGLERIRFMTSHPKDLSDELIEVMSRSKKICRHLHLPVQSGSSRILKKMNRRYTKEHYLELVDKIKKAVPDISLTTDIIVGFPGETEEDFQETLDVVRKVCYDIAFTFIYSKRTGTPAAVMEDQVSEAEVKDRFDRLLKEVQTISAQRCAIHEGTVQKALVECQNEHDPSLVTGRLSNNLLVHFPGDPSLIGRLVDVSLDDCKGFYYMGKMKDTE